MTKIKFLIPALIAILFYSCQDYRDIEPLSTTGTVTLAVDENFEPAMDKLIAEFERINQRAKVEVQYLPTKNAVAELLNNEVNLIVINRPFDQEEKDIIEQFDVKIDSHYVAVDAIAFIVNPQNPVSRVTSENLKKIFTGEITNWTQIQSQDENQNREVAAKMTGNLNRIKPFIQRRNSATYEYVKTKVLNGGDFYDRSIMCSTSAQVINEVRENVNAIGITNLAWLGIGNQDELDSTVKPLRISVIDENGFQKDFVQLHQGFVFNDTYPYNRIVYIYTTFRGVGIESGFISFMLQTPGQQVLLNHGVVPSTQPVRTIQLK